MFATESAGNENIQSRQASAAVQNRLHSADRLATRAKAQDQMTHYALRELSAAKLSTVGSFAATSAGASALAGLLPDTLLTEAQKHPDKATLASMLTPEGGKRHGTQFDVRVSNISRPNHRRVQLRRSAVVPAPYRLSRPARSGHSDQLRPSN